MPKRQRERKIECDEVQGEDSWCIVRSPKYELVVRAMELANDPDERLQQLAGAKLGEELMEEAIVEWNWVDDNGKPMEQYGGEKGTKATDLTIDEVMFLLDAIMGDSRRKN